jgi:hypothetical protein
VDNWWNTCAETADDRKSTGRRPARRAPPAGVDDLRAFVRLIAAARSLEYRFAPRGSTSLTTTSQRVVQRIHGRDYRVEVTQIAFERWRAHVINAHGGPTALMPFYATTPDQAIGRLTDWLARAHQQAAAAAAAATPGGAGAS